MPRDIDQSLVTKVLTGLQVGSWVATILLVPLLGWALSTILDLEMRVTRVETREEQYVTGSDVYQLQSQISELALTTQAAIAAIRTEADRLAARMDDLEHSREQ